MKILFTSKKQRAYVKSIPSFNIISALKKINDDVTDIHILADDGSKDNEYKIKPLEYNYKFFEEYNTDNISRILELEKPDVLISSNDYDYFGRAFIISAKKKNIPTVLLLQGIFVDIYLTKSKKPLVKNRYIILRKRGKFIFKKFRLLLKTYKKLGYSTSKILKLIIDDIITPFFYSEPSGKYGCDLILVTNENDKKALQERGIKSEILITGDPEVDSTFRKIQTYKSKKSTSNKLKIILLTTAMIEHGLWTKKMWEDTMTQVIKGICVDFKEKMELALKIHPTSELIQDYEELFEKIGLKVPIFQTKDLFEVICEADIILTLEGGTWANWSAILVGKPLIIVNTLKDTEVSKFPYLKEKIAYELNDIKELPTIIEEIQKNYNSEKNKEFIEKQHYKFDGKSSERSAIAIIDLIKKKRIEHK